SNAAAPKGWPPELRYLTRLEWAKDVPAELVRFYTTKPALAQSMSGDSSSSSMRDQIPVVTLPQNRRPLVRIVKVTDPSHPAVGQRSLHALATIGPGTHILTYIGIVRPEASASTTSDYIINLGHGLSIDAEIAGNEARFFNDYRGIGVRPNARFEVFRDAASGVVGMGVVSTCKIAKGQEVLVSYGKGFWKGRSTD
ncbi:hypothetical protein BC831DRAFT_381158, partial [Entophlyctis helioformis]